jgi:predicted TIM-barrel fold metal-dependent hydrolase
MSTAPSHTCSRRVFLGLVVGTIASAPSILAEDEPEPIIDIHQHLGYSGRTDAQFLAHQKAMGVTMTILLPAGRELATPSTHDGKSNGLAAQISGNAEAEAFAKARPGSYRFFANEITDLTEARTTIDAFIGRGAIGIGEQKFGVDCDSKEFQALCDLARERHVPILCHFQHETYNHHFERFHTVLAKYPEVRFIGHAQTMWAYIDAKCDPKILYPTGPVTPGGLTDRYLTDYPNFFADMSAGSGLNALIRDEDHTRGFLGRHQDKILFGSDCNDIIGRGPGCQGTQTIAAVRRLAPSKAIERKILFGNSKKFFGL